MSRSKTSFCTEDSWLCFFDRSHPALIGLTVNRISYTVCSACLSKIFVGVLVRIDEGGMRYDCVMTLGDLFVVIATSRDNGSPGWTRLLGEIHTEVENVKELFQNTQT